MREIVPDSNTYTQPFDGKAAERSVGFVLILVSATAFGAMPVFARFAYASGVDAFSLLFLRFTMATTLIATIMAIRRIPLPRGRALLGLIAMGAFGYVGQSMCYFTALRLASASLVSLVLYLYPVFVAGLAAVILKERLTATKLVALAVALAGAALTIGFGGGGTPAGVAAALGAALAYSLYIIAGTRLLRSVAPIPATAVIMASTGLVYAGLVAVRGPVWPATARGLLAIVAIAAISTVLATTTFFAGLERIGPTNASLLSTFEPVVAVVLAALVLGERLAPLSLLGGALILAAAIMVARAEWQRPERSATAEPA